MPRDRHWESDVSPTKGSNKSTAFLKSNFKILSTGGVFRTVKAKFPPATIQAEAKKAGRIVRIDEEGPWLKVTIVGRMLRDRDPQPATQHPRPPKIEKQPDIFS